MSPLRRNVLGSTLAVALMGCQGAVAVQSVPTTLPARSWERLRTACQGLGLEIPANISDRDLARYVQFLDLSQAQAQYLRSHHQDYVARVDALEREHVAAFAAAAKAFNPSQYGPQYYTGFANWRKVEDGFNKVLVGEDNRLFVVLELVLSEQQHERLARVQMHRHRARCSPPRWRGMFAARIDLSRLIEQMPWPPEASQCVDALLWEYEQALTPVLLEAHQSYRADGLRREALRHDSQFDAHGAPRDQTVPGVVDHKRACRDAIAATYRSHARLQNRLANLNETFLSRFLAELPAEHAHMLEQAFLRQAYPRVYPDLDDPEPVFQRLVADHRIESDQQALLQAQWEIYRGQYRAVCAAMMKESRDWQEQMIGAVSPSASPEHNARMEALTAQRVAVGDEFLVNLLSLLPPALAPDAREMVEQWRAETRRNAEQRSRVGNGVDMR